ncbi:uncharacterized protein SPAPADRAFT_50489 [Spathaspora passalidarum NRRL Y-27907]|uniref:Uncharacterized protein n=1 Tax=Spathaspora passalidarum (strain NRRL Y-27907 / 11-Y1) TaxID=619300 RepID=G3AKM9_SPAPN|nr:uncharacterized protein SPAPADRAFT_50489 [Spathaspora passalidarum NRRL Y-27907]EGW33634.1 hypothetical protein SPAPADRAFT_50489 [Spathaspora passalidarum NRRL Y-27907]
MKKQEVPKRTVFITKLETYFSTVIPEEVTDSTSTETSVDSNTITDVESTTAAHSSMVTTLPSPYYTASETFTTTETAVASNQERPISKQELLAMEEIKRLEQLLLDLKKEMLLQQENFRLQMLSIYNATKEVTTTKQTTQTAQTTNVIGLDHEKNHGKNILNQKNPSNSVLIVPQFQNHRKENEEHSTHVYHHEYAKPKVPWYGVAATTETTTSDEISIAPTPEPEKDNLHPFAPIKTGEVQDPYDYVITYDVTESLQVSKDTQSTQSDVTETPIATEDTTTVTATATVTKRRDYRFRNNNSTIDFDVFHLDVSENQGNHYKKSFLIWLLASVLMCLY